jgi:TRAP-type C4-dicarboxylate transport system permease small subunit
MAAVLCRAAMENVMSVIYRTFRWIAAAAMACAVGNLPGCGTMGGGGMRYLAPDPIAVEQVLAI